MWTAREVQLLMSDELPMRPSYWMEQHLDKQLYLITYVNTPVMNTSQHTYTTRLGRWQQNYTSDEWFVSTHLCWTLNTPTQHT